MNKYQSRHPLRRRVPAKLLLLFGLLLLIGLVEFATILWQLDNAEPAGTSNSGLRTNQTSNKSAASTFDKSKYPLGTAASLWAVVNKGRILPADYIPDLAVPDMTLRYSPASSEMKLRSDAAQALKKLSSAAAKDRIYLRLSSGYRSYYTQGAIYNREVRTYGQAQADRQSARPGHSEHQTGLAADLAPSDGRCEIADCFADTAEGKWLLANAHKFGFILRYPDAKENQTGYRYEPWHFRFVGTELASAIYQAGQTFEEFFNLPANTSYPQDIYRLL